MSRQSFEGARGKTSHGWRSRFLFRACLVLLIAGACCLLIVASFWWYGSQTEKLVNQQNRNTGRLLMDQVMCIEHWEKLETVDDFKPVVRSLTQRLSNQEYDWRMLRPDGTVSAGAPPDVFEWELLKRLLKSRPDQQAPDEGPEFAERLTATGAEYHYYQAIRAEDSCIQVCHKPPPVGAGIGLTGEGFALGGGGVSPGASLSEGDLMAVVHVTIPNGPTQRAINWNRAILLSTAIITAFLTMLAFLTVFVLLGLSGSLRARGPACREGSEVP